MFTDAPSRAQRVAISWTMETPRDPFADSPDERDEGFFPSIDPDAPGYIGDPDATDVDGTAHAARYESETEAAKARLAAWYADEWHYVGVVARAVIHIPIGGISFRVLELRSSGVWGIESDSGDYIRQQYADERDTLLMELRTLAAAFILGMDQEESE